MQAASYFDKQQVILTNSKLFWHKQQVMQFWQTVSTFEKQQVSFQTRSYFDKSK